MKTRLYITIVALVAFCSTAFGGAVNYQVKDNHDGFYDIELTNTLNIGTHYDITYTDSKGIHVLKDQFIAANAKDIITVNGNPSGIFITVIGN